jgi:DNA invertase Pin-like site-specific DNA recombinase
LHSLAEAIDTTTPGRRLVFHGFAALAEFERSVIRERTVTGLEGAREGGLAGDCPVTRASPSRRWPRAWGGDG